MMPGAGHFEQEADTILTVVDEKLEPILADVLRRNAGEAEFHQAVTEVLQSLGRVIAKHPEYADNALIERICEPERQIIFRVPWIDDKATSRLPAGFASSSIQHSVRTREGFASIPRSILGS
jgi:hypothetical protein